MNWPLNDLCPVPEYTHKISRPGENELVYEGPVPYLSTGLEEENIYRIRISLPNLLGRHDQMMFSYSILHLRWPLSSEVMKPVVRLYSWQEFTIRHGDQTFTELFLVWTRKNTSQRGSNVMTDRFLNILRNCRFSTGNVRGVIVDLEEVPTPPTPVFTLTSLSHTGVTSEWSSVTFT